MNFFLIPLKILRYNLVSSRVRDQMMPCKCSRTKQKKWATRNVYKMWREKNYWQQRWDELNYTNWLATIQRRVHVLKDIRWKKSSQHFFPPTRTAKSMWCSKDWIFLRINIKYPSLFYFRFQSSLVAKQTWPHRQKSVIISFRWIKDYRCHP